MFNVFIQNKSIFNFKFLKFLLVGLLNTIFGYSIYALLLSFGWHYSVAIGVATIIGTFFNYNSIGKFVFNNNKKSRLIYFFLVYVLIYFLNVIFIKILLNFGIPSWLGGLLLLLPVAIFSYYLNSKLVFNDEKN